MNWLPIIVITAQVTLVAALGLLLASLFRSAAHRHSVLLTALCCILAGPLFYAGAVGAGLSVELPITLPVSQEAGEVGVSPIQQASTQQRSVLPVSNELAPPAADNANSATVIDNANSPIATSEVTPQKPQATGNAPLHADVIVLSIWLLGTMICFVGILRSLLKSQSILKAVRPISDAMHGPVVAEASRQLGANGVLRVGTTGKVAGPVVVGIFEPWILIPARYLETLTRDELLQVLIHEGAHALRHDPLRALGQRVCRALFWWHPLVHFLNQQLTRAREEICDNFVLSHVPPVTYGNTLLRLATLSPAMARFPLAIGMFDGRGKLEGRIRGLLDSRRPIMTQIRFSTAATVLGAFVLFSTFIAASRVSAQNANDDIAETTTTVPAKAEASTDEVEIVTDPKQFRLNLTYHGESDKPFYDLILSVPPVSQQKSPFTLFESITEDQASRILKYLKATEFFQHAEVPATQEVPKSGPQYLLRVSMRDRHYQQTLGWDLGTLLRLDALRKTLEGRAAELMDQLLGRLAGQRKAWEPLGRLRPLVKEGWSLEESPERNFKFRPGSNWGETTGRIIRFVKNPPARKGDGLINLWLADEPATAALIDPRSSIPASKYLGKLDRWHVYFLASEKALEAWPSAIDDIKASLAPGQQKSSKVDTSDDEYRLILDRYKMRILAAARAGKKEEIATLTDEFNQFIGGKLLYVQVVSRGGPIAEHKTLFSQFYGERKISIGKIDYPVATKPYVTPNANGEGYVLIATNPLSSQKWPDDLQITLALEHN